MKEPCVVQKNIRKYLHLRKMKAKELAERVGMSPQVISNIVNCKRKVYADEIMPICRALGVSVADIYGS